MALRRFPRLVAMVVLVWVVACAPMLQPLGDGNGPARFDEGIFVTRDGLELPLKIWRPDGTAHAVILALHGFNDYSNAFLLPGPQFADRGIIVYAYDQRGFGKAPYRGRWAGVATLVGDAADAVRLLHERHPDLPLYVLGESMGGAVTMVMLAGDHRPGAPDLPMAREVSPAPLPVTGAILVAPAVWGRTDMGILARGLLAFTAYTIPWYTLTGQGLHILPTDNLSVLRGMVRDPLVIKQTRIDAVYGLVNLMDAAVAAAPYLTTPTLFLYGLNDQVIPPSATLRTIETLPGPPLGNWRVAVYKNGYHMLLRDLQAETVVEDIAAWIADPAMPLPSGADMGGVAVLEARSAE